MGKTKITSIRVDEKLFEEAKRLGLNISRISENAVREAVSALKRSKGADCPDPHNCGDINVFNGGEPNITMPASWWAAVGRKPEETLSINQARGPERAWPRGQTMAQKRNLSACAMTRKRRGRAEQDETANPRDARANDRR